MPSNIWAGTAAETEPSVAIADLERLVRHLENPQQRAELLKILQALIAVAKQQQAEIRDQETRHRLTEPSQGLFFAFGQLTQHLTIVGRRIVQRFSALPALLGELPAHLQEPSVLWFFLYLALSAFVLVALGILLQRVADRAEKRFRSRTFGSEPIPAWRKVWLSLLTLGLAAAPYVALLAMSGVVFSILPIGAVASGIGALLIATFLLYRGLRAGALVLFNPDRPGARLLPLRNSTAQYAWNWAVRLSLLAAAYLVVTRTLLTIGVTHEVFEVVRGLLVLVWAVVLSRLVIQVARRQPTLAANTSPDDRRRRWTGVTTTLQRMWPLIALAYLWCGTLLALVSSQPSLAFIVAASLRTALVIAVGLALLGAGEYLLNTVAGLNNQVGRYIPGLEVRTLRYLRMLWWSIRVLFIVAAMLCILQVWGVGIHWFLTSTLGIDLLSRLLTLLVTVAAVMVVIDLSTFISQGLIQPSQEGVEASKKRKTLVPLTATVIKSAALFVGALVTLHLVGINVTPILAGVGIFSLAIGFGAQTLVKDIINGLFILVEDSISVGDVVNIRGTGGAVEAVNLRTIWLRDLQGSVHIIPNSQVEMITNMTKDYAYYVLDVTVAYREDTDEVIAALQEIDAEMRAEPIFAADMLTPIDILGVERFTDSAVLIRARLKTKASKQWSIGREFNRRMKKLFEARGIEIPFPTRTIYWGEPKRGEAPALQLHLQNRQALASTSGQGEPRTATRPDGVSDRH